MKTKFKSKNRSIILFTIVGTMAVFFYRQNNDIQITRMTYINKKVPLAFDGFVVVHISDLHNMRFGKDQNILLTKVKDAAPDIIVVTGDIVDSERTDVEIAMEFIRGTVDIAPVYFVSGNHEERIKEYVLLIESMIQAGVHMLDNKQTMIERGGSNIELMGIIDPFFAPAKSSLDELNFETQDSFKILLSHRAELLKLYASKHIDLVFTGHAHGGQVRIPYIMPGLIAPHQGLFPKYTSGAYISSDTTEIVSRGLGNSSFPFRIFNRPEIIVVTLKSK